MKILNPRYDKLEKGVNVPDMKQYTKVFGTNVVVKIQ